MKNIDKKLIRRKIYLDQTKRNKNVHFNHILVFITTIAFLSSYFICKGPQQQQVINLTHLEIIIILSIYIIEFFLKRIIHITSLFFLFFVYILMLSHIHIINDYNLFDYYVMCTRLYGYLIIVFLFSIRYFEWKFFYKLFLYFSYSSIILAIISYYFLAPSFIDYGYGFKRARAFLSEPSGFGPIISILLFDSLERKSIIGIMIVLLATYCIGSGTVYSVMILTTIVYLFKKFITNLKYKIIIVFTLCILILFLVAFYPKVQNQLHNSFNYNRLVTRIKNLVIYGEKWSRLSSLFNLYDTLKQEDSLLTGRGFNSTRVYFGSWEKLPENREFSILHSFLFSYGVPGVIFILFILGYAFVVLWKQDSIKMIIFYSAFLFSSLLNSSGGHVLYKFCYLVIFIIIYSELRHLRIILRPLRQVNLRSKFRNLTSFT